MGESTTTDEKRPLLRGWLHAVAVPVAVGTGAAVAARRPTWRPALAAYGAGVSGMFAASAVYHRLSASQRVVAWTRPADHAAIFGAIAGTATPVIAATTSGKTRLAALGAAWGASAVAAADRFRRVRSGRTGGGASYLVVGWGAAALLPALLRRHGSRTAAKLIAGGAVYSAGAAVLAARTPDPHPRVFGYHEVWHLLTLVGAGLHLAAVLDVTRDGDAATNPRGRETPSTRKVR